MRYRLADIEDQIIATLKIYLPDCQIATHVGTVSPRTFQDPALLEGFIHQLPFVFSQYQYRETFVRDAAATTYDIRLFFRFYVGAKSLRTQQEGQRAAYDMLGTLYDALHGKWPKGTYNLAPNLQKLEGTSITTAGFNPQGPMMLTGGRDEQLVVNLPTIVVYQTDYSLQVLA